MLPKAVRLPVILLGALLAATVLGMLGGYLAASWKLREPLERLNLTTPVFVLDRGGMIRALPPDASPAQMAKMVEDWKNLANKLSAAGYLVIDSTAVVAAPEDLYVGAEQR